jgi:hypothetical protein
LQGAPDVEESDVPEVRIGTNVQAQR